MRQRALVNDMPPIHPAAEVFPLMSEEELAGLAEDIKANGQIHPIVLHEGAVLDGRNRWLACQRVNIKPRTVKFKGKSPTAYACSVNDKRRHMTPAQRAAVAVELTPLFQAEAREREREGGKRGAEITNRGSGKSSLPRKQDDHSRAAAQAAKAAGAGVKATQALATVKREAPEVFELAKQGELSVTQAKTVSTLPIQQQAEVIDLVKSGAEPKEAIAQVKNDWMARAEKLGTKIIKGARSLHNTAIQLKELCHKHSAAIRSIDFVITSADLNIAVGRLSEVIALLDGKEKQNETPSRGVY